MRIIAGSIIGFIHVIAAVFLIGGSFFFNSVLNPSLKGLEPPVAGKLNQSVGARFNAVAWITIILLLLTGLLRAFGSGAVTVDTLLSTTYGQVLTAKVILFVIAVIIAVMITTTGLNIAKLAKNSPPPLQEIAVAQGRLKMLSTTNLIIGIIIIFLAVLLRFLNT